jgi:polysaccharide export outer membrane protein
MIQRIFSIALIALFAGCAQLPPAPAKIGKYDYVYRIGPGDNLEISVWRNPDLSTKVPVRPDGKITTPLIEDLIVVGKTPQDLGREIEDKLRKYIREPSVTVLVTQIVGDPLSVIRVIGQAQRPGSIPYRQGMTLLDVMTAANGLTRVAAGNSAVLVRAIENNKQYRVRIKDLLNAGDPTANVEIAPGDSLMIPESAL